MPRMYIKNQPINHNNKLGLVAPSLASLIYMTSARALRTSVVKNIKKVGLVRWLRG